MYHDKFAENEGILFRLLTNIYCDSIPSSTYFDAVAIFSQAAINESPMLKCASETLLFGRARNLAISGARGSTEKDIIFVKNPETLVDELVDHYAVPIESIITYAVSDEFPISTDAEAFGLIAEAQKRGWQSLCITTPPLHQVRAFISVISALLKSGKRMKIYSLPSLAKPWTEEVMHSQSSPKLTRSEHLLDELQKMIQYQRQGSHSSPEEILLYLNSRDK